MVTGFWTICERKKCDTVITIGRTYKSQVKKIVDSLIILITELASTLVAVKNCDQLKKKKEHESGD